MDSKQSLKVRKYLDLFLRKKFFILIILLLSLPAGLGVYLVTPKVYQATSLLSYQKQKISPNKMSPDIASRIRDVVSTLTQIVTSRTNLEALISSYNLYKKEREKLPMEDVVEMMRNKIVIRPQSRGDVFTISFTGSDPAKVVKVTNALAAKFIEENLKYRQERATETTSYTSDELQMAKLVMDRKENAMRDYKLKYYNEMPEQRETNVARLIALQEQYQSKQESIQDLERTLVLIQDQLGNRKRMLGNFSTLAELDSKSKQGDIPSIGGSIQKLAKMKLMLDRLLIKYTEKHPEVKRIRKIIARLEKEVKAQEGQGNGGLNDSAQSGMSVYKKRIAFDSVIVQLEAQRKNIKLNIAAIKKEKDQLKQKIEQYEKWVAAAPIREAEWTALTREYSQLKRHYDYLVSQNLQAKSMLNLERRQKGSQFKIEDPARYPQKPIKPDFFIIVGGALCAGLALSFGATLLLDFLDSSFRDEEEMENFLGVPLITTVPYIETNMEKRKNRWILIMSCFFLVCCFLGIAALFFYFWKKGYIVL